MMTNLLPRLDRGVDNKAQSEAPGAMPEIGIGAGDDGVEGARLRSPFAELLSASDVDRNSATDGRREPAVKDVEAAAVAVKDRKAGAAVRRTEVVAEPFEPSFDLPAFLQVLPRSGGEVAVAAAREPGLAAAVRRLSISKSGAEARAIDAPDAAIRLPAFLVTPKADVPAEQVRGAAGSAQASAKALTKGETVAPTPLGATSVPQTTAPAQTSVGAMAEPVTFTTAATDTPAAKTARTATTVLESALRRAAAPSAAKESNAPTAATAPTTDPAAQAALTMSMSASAQPLALHTARLKVQHPIAGVRKDPAVRADPAVPAQRDPVRPEPGAAVAMLQRSFESAASIPESADRWGQVGRAGTGGADAGTSNPGANVGMPVDLASPADPSVLDASGRTAPAAVALRHPVGTEAWQDELSAQLSFMADQGEGTEAVMKLAPEELGELEVRVEVRDGEAVLQFGVMNADARQAVEAAQSKLRDLFSTQGMNVTEFRVFSNLHGNSQSFSNDGRGSRSGSRPSVGGEGDLEVVVRPRRSVGIVDLYA